jgi:hypothetical protein
LTVFYLAVAPAPALCTREVIELTAGLESTGYAIEAHIAQLEANVAHLRGDAADIKVDLRARFDRMDARMDHLDARIDARTDDLRNSLDSGKDKLASAQVSALILDFALAGSMLGVMARGLGWI